MLGLCFTIHKATKVCCTLLEPLRWWSTWLCSWLRLNSSADITCIFHHWTSSIASLWLAHIWQQTVRLHSLSRWRYSLLQHLNLYSQNTAGILLQPLKHFYNRLLVLKWCQVITRLLSICIEQNLPIYCLHKATVFVLHFQSYSECIMSIQLTSMVLWPNFWDICYDTRQG